MRVACCIDVPSPVLLLSKTQAQQKRRTKTIDVHLQIGCIPQADSLSRLSWQRDEYAVNEWNKKKFDRILEREFQGEELQKIGKQIVGMWDKRDREQDIIEFARKVADACCKE